MADNEGTKVVSQGGTTNRHSIFMNASILEEAHKIDILREEVRQNRVQFLFPDGFADIPVIEECRILEDIENFTLMFDILMQKLAQKHVLIYLKDDEGKAKEVARFYVTDRYMNLRGVPFIAKYPVVINWLMEFFQVDLLKKFPLPPPSWEKLEAKIKKSHKKETQE